MAVNILFIRILAILNLFFALSINKTYPLLNNGKSVKLWEIVRQRIMKARDKETGKFVVKEDTFDKIVAVRVNAELKQWVKQQGGSDFVRSLIIAAKTKQETKQA